MPGSSLSTRALWEVMTAQTVVPSSRVTRTSASISPSWTLCTLPEKWLRALVGAGLRKALEGVLDAPLRIDALTLFKQENRNRPFSAVARLPFANVQTAQETA